MKKNGFRFLLLFILFTVILSPSIRAQMMAANSTCPVMPGERVKEKFFVDYQGRRIYLCCRNCVIAFRKKPEKYMKRLAVLEREIR